MPRNFRGLTLALGTFTSGWIAVAQPPSSFEVVAIHPADPLDRRPTLMGYSAGRFTADNASLRTLIAFSYDVRDDQIAGGPNWLDSANYSIQASIRSAGRAPDDQDAPQVHLMAQGLLADRFELVLHREIKQEQVYRLVLAKGGSKLKGGADVKPGPLRVGRGLIAGTSVPMGALTALLAGQLGRTVIDETGLQGKFVFELKYAPELGVDADTVSDPSGSSIFTALQEQLGLRLESGKGPVEVLIVDRAEKPSSN